MKEKIVLVFAVVAIVLVSGCLDGDKSENSLDTAKPMESTGEVKEFNMIARQWEFEPNTITVNKGDTVKLNIESVDVTHGISIGAFGVNSRLEPGETTTVEFVADKAGTYSFFCSVQCGAGHGNMRGTLIVE